jgi:hypothetical protein
MLKKRFIVVSRSFGDEESIKALSNPFDEELTFTEISGATETIERDLVERGMQARAAARFAYGVAGCRIGVVHHAPEAPDMYYRILVANFTSNRAPITPGLHVLDYDQRKGHVVAPQFMATSSLAPGGEYFDGWYHVEANGSTRLFNGSRLRAL